MEIEKNIIDLTKDDVVSLLTGDWCDTRSMLETIQRGMADTMRMYVNLKRAEEIEGESICWKPTLEEITDFEFTMWTLQEGLRELIKKRRQ